MPIVLMTDFGSSDVYPGILKGVLARIAPAVPVLDLTHEIAPYNILQGAFQLARSFRYFPQGSIFVAVVDPGVGGARRPILVETQQYHFIAPDNGLLTMVLHQEKPKRIYCLDNPRYHLPEVSGTFHGRDLFAPAAAHLANGVAPGELGSPLEEWARLPECFPQRVQGRIVGRIVNIDRFGNCFTNVDRGTVETYLKKNRPVLRLKGGPKDIGDWVHHYGEGKKGSPILLWSSSGFLEIALREGSAAAALKIKIGREIGVQ